MLVPSARRKVRSALTLLECIVVLAILGVLMGLLVPAVQRARAAADLLKCKVNLHQIGIALHQYHDAFGSLPPGVVSRRSGKPFRYMGWETRLLPFVDQQQLWNGTLTAYTQAARPFNNPPHVGLGALVKVFTCPTDSRVAVPQSVLGRQVTLTSYLGVAGADDRTRDGVLYADSSIRLAEITDGTSHTLAVGERPPSFDFRFGWWYAGIGYNYRGTCDMLLGVRERNQFGAGFAQCPGGPFRFEPGLTNDICDIFHFWSLHSGGSPFLFADGSVRFLEYTADSILPALASRAGGDVFSFPN